MRPSHPENRSPPISFLQEAHSMLRGSCSQSLFTTCLPLSRAVGLSEVWNARRGRGVGGRGQFFRLHVDVVHKKKKREILWKSLAACRHAAQSFKALASTRSASSLGRPLSACFFSHCVSLSPRAGKLSWLLFLCKTSAQRVCCILDGLTCRTSLPPLQNPKPQPGQSPSTVWAPPPPNNIISYQASLPLDWAPFR